MVRETRSAPTFPHDVQRQLWDIRRESTILSGFKFKEELEERLIQGLSVEEATAAVAEAEADLEAWKKLPRGRKRARNRRRPPLTMNTPTVVADPPTTAKRIKKSTNLFPNLNPKERARTRSPRVSPPANVPNRRTGRTLPTPNPRTTMMTNVGKPVVAIKNESGDAPLESKPVVNLRRNCSR
jgi:hypothetical protein